MDNYPGNSRRAGQQPPPSEEGKTPGEERKLDPVVTGKVVVRKKPLGRRIIDTFFKGDGGVLHYLAMEVLVPALQNLVIDTVTEGIHRAVGGQGRVPRRTNAYHSSFGSRTSISRDRPTTITRSSPLVSNSYPSRRPLSQSSALDNEEIILDSHFEAEVVVEKMYDTIQEYGAATVANLKELLKQTASYTDHKWGWREDATFTIKRVGGGYFRIDYPEPEHLR